VRRAREITGEMQVATPIIVIFGARHPGFRTDGGKTYNMSITEKINLNRI
jgi:hypothetical protein